MTNEELSREVDRLRTELSQRTQSEVVALKEALAEAKHEAEHFRKEANRNAELGRKIAADYQSQLIGLRSEVETLKNREAYERRFNR